MKTLTLIALILAVALMGLNMTALSVFTGAALLVMWRHWFQIGRRMKTVGLAMPTVPANDQVMTLVWSFVLLLAIYLGAFVLADPFGYRNFAAGWLDINVGMASWVECCNISMPESELASIRKDKAVFKGVAHIVAVTQMGAIIWGALMVLMMLMAKWRWPRLSFSGMTIGPFRMPLSGTTGWSGIVRIGAAAVLLYAMFLMVTGAPGERSAAQTVGRLVDPRESQLLFLLWQGVSALLILLLASGLCALILTDRIPGLGWLFQPKVTEEDEMALLSAGERPLELGSRTVTGNGPGIDGPTGKVKLGHDVPLLPREDEGGEDQSKGSGEGK